MKKSKVKTNAKKVAKKAVSHAKKATKTVKAKGRTLLSSAKKQLNSLKKKSSKNIGLAKDKIIATEEEIMDYVKANPIKSISAVALTTLIGGFIASRYKK